MEGVKYHPTHKWYPGTQGVLCAAGQGMVFDLSVLKRVYNFVWVCLKGITCMIDLIGGWILFVLQVNKSNDYNVNFFYSGVASLYKPYRYVPPHRVGFLHRFGLKTGIHFAHFGLESSVVFEGTAAAYERIYRFNSKWVRKKEKYANSKWIWIIFCLRSNG